MKSSKSILIIATFFFTIVAAHVQLAAQEHTHYKLIDLGAFGGPQSYVNIPDDNYAPVLNNQGTVVGWADTSTPDPYPNFCFDEDCFVARAFEWSNGVRIPFRGLAHGLSSLTAWISANGLITGTSENGEIDPLVSGFPELRAVLWKNGQIADLGTLPEGGYESAANAINSRSQVVGLATNTTPDSNSLIGLGYQTRAFLWDQERGMQDLGTLGTGTDAEAILVNDQDQIVGESYVNSTPSAYCAAVDFPLTTDAFLWEDGEMKDLGTFGGTCTLAFDLNNHGEVVGFSTLAGDQFQHAFLWARGSLHDLPNTLGGNNANAIQINEAGDAVGFASLPDDQTYHATLWTNSGMTDLGTLEGDQCSFADTVNATRQVVGQSATCDFGQVRAFLWENGSMVDLNTLIPPNSPLYLTSPGTINDRGEIAGMGVDSNGNQHAFLLVPCGDDDTACRNAVAGRAFRPTPVMTKPASNQNNAIRRMLRRRLGPLYKVPAPNASSEPRGAASADSALAAEGVFTKTDDSMLNSLDSHADPISRFATAPRCTREGWPCGREGPCCAGLKCVFHGGSTRAGYACEP